MTRRSRPTAPQQVCCWRVHVQLCHIAVQAMPSRWNGGWTGVGLPSIQSRVPVCFGAGDAEDDAASGSDDGSEEEVSEEDSDAGASSADDAELEAAGPSDDAELDRALLDVMAAQAVHRRAAAESVDGEMEVGPTSGEGDNKDLTEPAGALPQPGAAEDSESSEDEHPNRNTGTSPLQSFCVN